MSGPFAKAAEYLREHGLMPLPLGGEDGKQARVRSFNRWRSPPSIETLRKWSGQYPGANVGILTGPLSRITVVEPDDYGLDDLIAEQFGPTSLRVITPPGRQHFYYRHAGERCANLRKSEGLPIDVKGIGGYVVTAPSVRPSGEFAGRCYQIAPGCDWDALRDLPTIKPVRCRPRRVQHHHRGNPRDTRKGPEATSFIDISCR